MADAMQKKNLDASPDEEKIFDHGERRAVSLGEFKVARAVLQPGFKWSEHVKPIAQTDSCQVEHNSIQLSGRVKIVMEDGSEMEVGPGDVYVVPPGHDAWVVGDEPAVGIEVSREAVEDWGKEAIIDSAKDATLVASGDAPALIRVAGLTAESA